MAYTQEFGSKDARWVYNYNGFWSKGVTIMQYESDSILDGIPTRIYKKEGIRYIRKDSSILKFALKSIYIRSIDGVVTTSEDAVIFDTLYNFKAEIGRSWYYTTHDSPSWWNDTITLTVWDTFTTTISGQRIFAQTVRYKFKSFTDRVDTVYEYMGAKRHYILPFDEEAVAVDGGEGGILRCFNNSILGTVALNENDIEFRFPYECDELTSAKKEIFRSLNYEIQSNPFSDILAIKNYTDDNKIVKLYNLQGQFINESLLMPGENIFDFNYLLRQCYVITIDNKFVYKIIKQ